jgi:predicted  nucleic acid-binding Zn-ribbon protein
VPDIRSNMHVIAQEEVEVERLEKQIAESEGTMGKDRADLLRLKNDLAGSQPSYQYGGRVYTVAQVKQDLANRFERAKTHEATLSSLREILSARQRSLAAARQKLEGMLATKRQLEVDLENLDARMKMVEVAQTTSAYNFDDSQLGRAKELIGEVRTRLSVAERLVNAQTDIQGEIPLTESAADNIVDQVTEYLSGDNGKVAVGK